MARITHRRVSYAAPIIAVALALAIAAVWGLTAQRIVEPRGVAEAAEEWVVVPVGREATVSTSTTMPAPAKPIEAAEAKKWSGCLPPIKDTAEFAKSASAECLATYRAEVRKQENDNRAIWLEYCVEPDGANACGNITGLPPLERDRLCGSTALPACREYYERPAEVGEDGTPIECTEGRIAPIDPCTNTVEYLAALKKAAVNG